MNMKKRGTARTLTLGLVLSSALGYGLWTADSVVAQGPGIENAHNGHISVETAGTPATRQLTRSHQRTFMS